MSAVGYGERVAYPSKGPTIGDAGRGVPSASTHQRQPSSLAQAQHQQRAPLTEARATVNLDHISQPLRSSKKTATPATDDRENRGAAAAPPQVKNHQNLPKPKDKVRPASPPPIIRDNHRTLSFEKVGFLGEVRDIRPNLCGDDRVDWLLSSIRVALRVYMRPRTLQERAMLSRLSAKAPSRRKKQKPRSVLSLLWGSYSDGSHIALC
jgi:hypothetical protein